MRGCACLRDVFLVAQGKCIKRKRNWRHSRVGGPRAGRRRATRQKEDRRAEPPFPLAPSTLVARWVALYIYLRLDVNSKARCNVYRLIRSLVRLLLLTRRSSTPFRNPTVKILQESRQETASYRWFFPARQAALEIINGDTDQPVSVSVFTSFNDYKPLNLPDVLFFFLTLILFVPKHS